MYLNFSGQVLWVGKKKIVRQLNGKIQIFDFSEKRSII
jgi:hypothetical protein